MIETYWKVVTIIAFLILIIYSYFVYQFIKVNLAELKRMDFSINKIFQNNKLRPQAIKVMMFFFLTLILEFSLFFGSSFLEAYLKSKGAL